MNKIAVVTGGAKGIGRAIVKAFERNGDRVAIIDLLDNPYFIGDIADEKTLLKFADKVIKDFGHVDYLVNNACLSKGGIDTCSYEDFNYVLRVGASAPFFLAKLFKDHFATGASIINISSTREQMSQANSESYSAAKGAIGALTRALSISLSGRVRVNAIAPGWIDTFPYDFSEADYLQHPTHSVGKPEDIAELVLFLVSDKAKFIDGETIAVDGGMSKQMIYHGDFGWSFDPKKK